ncbi:uncharacterized protein LOC108047749 isoform X3 [Drosophila rhopaloa]|uniref:Uncharacterized protein LOC108047749 isoform X3 n=1 Tax=Drosophila rhopaloa TaxID=1041015 RepID=A0A6P4F8B0_DRORH|nr:uncharacterized protein LOC108047749 isoform X3 [Drosophila rhopaloa]
MFKLIFKQYKTKSSSPDLTDVINVDDIDIKQNDPQKNTNSVVNDTGLLDVYGTTHENRILLI